MLADPKPNKVLIPAIPLPIQLTDYFVHLILYFSTNYIMVRKMLQINRECSLPLGREMERKSVQMLLISGFIWIGSRIIPITHGTRFTTFSILLLSQSALGIILLYTSIFDVKAASYVEEPTKR
jgi:hypothetical protein